MGLDVYDDAKMPPDGAAAQGMADNRRYLGVLFECCGVYARVYREAGAPAYEGRCPKCMRTVRVGVGPGGIDARFFRAG